MSAAARPSLQAPPGFLSRRGILRLAFLLGLLTLLLALGYTYLERQDIREMRMEQLEQHSRLLERLTTNELANVELALVSLSETMRAIKHATSVERLDALLGDSVRARPLLRSLSVLEANGRVLASSNPYNVNATVDIGLLGGLPSTIGAPVFGPILNGRDLGGLSTHRSDLRAPTVLPVLWHSRSAAGEPLLLVALLNPDYLSTQYALSLGNATLNAALTDYSGSLLTSTDSGSLPAGKKIAWQAIQDLLRGKDAGQYIGTDFEAGKAMFAFRATRKWPLVILVGQEYDTAMAVFQVLLTNVLIAVFVIWLVLGTMAALALRSLRRHALTDEQLRKAEQAVRASEAHAMAVLRSNMDAVVTVDAGCRIVSFNPAAEKMFCRSGDAVMGRPMYDLLVLPEHRQYYIAGAEQFVRNGSHPLMYKRIEHVGMRADGSAFPAELTVVPVHIGDQVFFTATLRDITDQRRDAQEKRDLLDRYQKLASYLKQQKMALDEHAIVSIEDRNGAIVYANDKLVEISGYAREELLGESELVLRRQLTAGNHAAMQAKLAAGQAWHGELVRRRRDGSVYWVSSTTVGMPDDDGALCQYITVQTDITEQRQAEEALRQARLRELETGNRIQQSLLAGMPTTQSAGVWLSLFSQASQGIDGDFVDVIRMGPCCTDIIVGDVMGKGVPAALMGAATKLQFSRSVAELLAEQGGSHAPPEPSAIVASVHRAMTPHLQQLDSFVTLTYLRIDTRRNMLTWVGCGHEEALLIGGEGQSMLLPNQHPPIGILSSDAFSQNDIALEEGDAVFLCSDGLADAIGADGERIGRDAINTRIGQYVAAGLAPASALQLLRRDLLDPATEVNDDVTMVLIKRPQAPAATARCELPVSLDSLQPLRDFLAGQLRAAAMPQASADLFLVAGVEVLTNVIRHARGLPPNAPVEVVARREGGDFVLDIMHLGVAFTPAAMLADIDLDAFPEGGFGLSIIRGACDDVAYLHEGGLNTVRMRRSLAAEAAGLQS